MQCSIHIPSETEHPRTDCSVGHCCSRKNDSLSQSHFLSPIDDVTVTAAIVLLLGLGGPAAIGFAIWSVAIDSIYRLALWSRSHVDKERSKIISPFVANDNSPAAIEMKIGILRVRATGFHVSPNVILRRVPHAVGFGSSRSDFSMEATA